MPAFWKIFFGIFCYVGAVVGVVLAVINASIKPPSTGLAVIAGIGGAVLLVGGVVLTRRPRY